MNYHSSSSDTLGTIEWEITEAPDWRTIYRGSRDIERGDIEIIRVAGLIWPGETPEPWLFSLIKRVTDAVAKRVLGGRNLYNKRIQLEGDFCFELADRPTEERQRLRGLRDGSRTRDDADLLVGMVPHKW